VVDTGVVAPAAGCALAVPVAEPVERGAGVREDGDAPAASRLGGIVTTVGGTAMARPAALAAARPGELAAVPDAGPESTPRAR
jgi:hypothetical protein